MASAQKPRAARIRVTKPAPLTPTPVAAVTVLLTKRLQLIGLLEREGGASTAELATTLGWLPHTTRAALTGLKKKGYVISSYKVEGVRTYRAVAPE